MDAVDGHDESEHEGGYRGKVSGSGFKVQDLASGLGVEGLRFHVQDLWFRADSHTVACRQ